MANEITAKLDLGTLTGTKTNKKEEPSFVSERDTDKTSKKIRDASSSITEEFEYDTDEAVIESYDQDNPGSGAFGGIYGDNDAATELEFSLLDATQAGKDLDTLLSPNQVDQVSAIINGEPQLIRETYLQEKATD